MSETDEATDIPLDHATFIALDLEATGLSTFHDPIVEVGAAKDVVVVIQEGVALEIKPTAGSKF